MRTILCLTLVTLFVMSLNSSRADWPQYLGPDRTAISTERGLAATWPADGPKVLWTNPLGEGFGGPAVKAGQVYLLDRVDDARDVLRCYDLASGKELWNWSNEVPGELDHNGSRATPTVDDKYVFAVGPFGHFYALDKASHQLAWTKNFGNEYGAELPRWGFSQSPLLYKDWVITAPLGASAGVVAYEKDSGELAWKSPKLAGRAGYASPIMANIGGVDQVVVLTATQGGRRRRGGGDEPPPPVPPENQGAVVGIDANSGKVLWEYKGWQCRNPIPSATSIGDGRIFITGGYGADSAMIKISKAGSDFQVEELYKSNKAGAQIHPAVLYKDHLYINSNDNRRRDGLMCMTLEGEVVWQTRNSPSFDKGAFLIADDKLFIVEGAKGDLYMLEPSPAGYKELAKAPMLGGHEIWSPIALSDGKLIVRDQSQIKCVQVK